MPESIHKIWKSRSMRDDLELTNKKYYEWHQYHNVTNEVNRHPTKLNTCCGEKEGGEVHNFTFNSLSCDGNEKSGLKKKQKQTTNNEQCIFCFILLHVYIIFSFCTIKKLVMHNGGT